MKLIKKCACGKEHKKLPKDMDVWRQDNHTYGYSFDCSCGSTLFVKESNIKFYDFEDPDDWRKAHP